MKKVLKVFALLLIAIVPLLVLTACDANGAFNLKVKDVELAQTSFEYDGEEHTIEIRESSLPQNIKVKSYAGDYKATNAGDYVARINLAYTEGEAEIASIELELPWRITKANVNVNLDNIALETNSLEYDGTIQTVSVNEETLPDNIEVVSITGNQGIYAGSYNAIINLRYTGEGAVNYKPISPVVRSFNITQATLVAPTKDDITFNALSYNGEQQEAVVNNACIPEGFTVTSITGNRATYYGTYTATLTLTYTGKGVDPARDALSYTQTVFSNIKPTFTISKGTLVAPTTIEMNALSYNGTIQTATVNEGTLGDWVVDSISGNTQKEVGEYNATLNLTYGGADAQNYESASIEGVSVPFTISKGTLNVNGVSLLNSALIYNKVSQKTYLDTSTLAENLIVANISGDEQTEEGNYTETITLLYIGEDADSYTTNVYTITRSWRIEKTINVATADEFVSAFVKANAGEGLVINITQDLDLSSKNNTLISSDVTVNLNGHTLNAGLNGTYTKFIFQVVNDATLTINGTETGSRIVGRLNVGKATENNGNLVLNGGTYEVVGGQTVIHVNGLCSNCAVQINNATIISPVDNAIQFNGAGTFSITNSTVTGYTAVYVKGGAVTITDSTITSTGMFTAPTLNTDGSNPTGDAIVLDTTRGYQGDIELYLEGETSVESYYAYAIRESIVDNSMLETGTRVISSNGATLVGFSKLAEMEESDRKSVV